MGKKLLLLTDFDLSIVPDVIRSDSYWQRCMELALCGSSKDQRFGSLVVSDGQIIGEGRNRLLGRDEKLPFRSSFFLHAEKDAIADAIRKRGEDGVYGSTIYVAGFFVLERRPIIFSSPNNTCVTCTQLYVRFGFNAAFAAKSGWVFYSGEEAYKKAVKNSRIRRGKGLTTRQFRKELSL